MFRRDLNKLFRNLLFATFLVFLVHACKKKEIPGDLIGSPVLFFNGTINGDSLDMTAGMEMNEAWGSSVSDNNGILIFNGGFRNSGKEPLELTVLFRDSIQRASLSQQEALTYFAPGRRNFYFAIEAEAQNYSIINFEAIPPPPGNNYQYRWYFEDGFISYFPSLTHRLQNNSTHTVKLIATNNGISDTLTNQFETSDNGFVCPLQFNYYQTINGYSFNATSGFIDYVWELPDGTIQNGQNIHWTPPASGKYAISCTGINPGVCQQSYTRKIIAGSSFNFAASDFVAKFVSSVNQNEIVNVGLNQVEIQLKGKWKGVAIDYSSKKRKNNFPTQNTFEILSANPFNEYNGIPTIKLAINFKGYLYNVLNEQDSIFVESGRVNMAFGYRGS